MSLCLYHPDHGYYMQGRERTGIGGDYFTSPDLHPIFARLIARQAAEAWEVLGGPAHFVWVEMGAGRGWFARDFLLWTREVRPDLWAALDYVVIEPAVPTRARVCARLAEDGGAASPGGVGERPSGAPAPPARLLEALQSKVRVLANLDELEPVTGCFFSNELVDAFPVSVVTRARGRLREVHVAADGEGLRETIGPISDSAVAAAVTRYAKDLEEGHRVEVNLGAVQWMRSLAEKLLKGFVITIDYGDLAERLYTSDRPRGTLLAYQQHATFEDSLCAPGEQDLTAHVNFSALIDAGREVGLELTGFTTQERLLMALGEGNEFADLYSPGQTEAERLQARLQLKRLLYPGGMGNVFKVLIQHRGVEAPRLTGLKHYRS